MGRASLASTLLLLVAAEAGAVQITATERLTSHPADQYNPVISGDVVVYTDTRAGNADIYLYSLATHQELNITNDPANQLLNDVYGDFIVYSDFRTGVAQVWAYYIPSGTQCRITYTSRASLSPSVGGEMLVFQDQNGTDSDIAAFDLSTLDTNDIAASCDALGSGQLAGPHTIDLGPGRQLSPKTSGDWVVYQGVNAENQPRIFAYNRETQLVTAMPERGKNQLLPDIDGTRVVYVEDDGTNRDIAFFDLGTSTFIQVTGDAYRQNFPSISGNFIAFEDSRAGNLDIYLYDISTGLLTALTNDPANQYLNSIDGERVVFTDASAGNLDVVMVTFDADPVPVPEPCEREGQGTEIADVTGRTVFALDDPSLITRRQFILWPFMHHSFTGGSFTYVSDHHRIVYTLDLPSDTPQAMVTIHAQLKQSQLPSVLLAAGLESRTGLVLRANGAERRWDDPANGVADVTLIAAKYYTPLSDSDAEVSLGSARAFRIPPTISVSAGNGGNHTATLTYRAGASEVRCTYRGGSSQAHPHNASQRARGRTYHFSSCDSDDDDGDDDDDDNNGHHGGHGHGHGHHDDGPEAGDTISADYLKLHVDSGDSEHEDGRTELTMRIYAVSSAGADAWTDVVIAAPIPLFAGNNEITLEGPEYGKAYMKYRRVDFKNGGTLRAVSRPACVPDNTLIPACHDSAAETLYGPVSFVRRGGAIETFPYHYETTATAAAILCVTNGDGDGSQRVSAAVIGHNGEPVLGPSAFGAETAETAAPLIAQLVNDGTVELRSAPGSYLTLKIVRLPPPPPTPPSQPGHGIPRLRLGDCSGAGDTPPLWLAIVLLVPLFSRARRRR
ncbi:MAG: hypothetical protein IT381_12905 [Deltaproteobacteria bacterium]|nr:hypothetical protein [Deltaproteobacteria bacterium]